MPVNPRRVAWIGVRDVVKVSAVGIAVGVNENVAPGDVFTNCAVITPVGNLAAPGELAVAGGAFDVAALAPLIVNVCRTIWPRTPNTPKSRPLTVASTPAALAISTWTFVPWYFSSVPGAGAPT